MSFTKSFVVLLSAFSCVQVLATPHAVRNVHHHRAVAARVAQPAPVSDFVPLVLPKKRDLSRRSLTRRCKARPAPTANSTSIAVSSTSSDSAASSPNAPVNVGSNPASISSDSSKDKPSPTPSSSSVDTPKPTPTPTPKPTPKPSPTSSQQPASTSPSSGSSGSGSGAPSGFLSGTQSGQGTFYSTGLGACGITNQDTDYIAAVSHLLFDEYPGYDGVNPNSNPVCGQKIQAFYQGKSVTITVTDRCTGCALTDLDFSPSAFDTLADPSLGRIDITWTWV